MHPHFDLSGKSQFSRRKKWTMAEWSLLLVLWLAKLYFHYASLLQKPAHVWPLLGCAWQALEHRRQFWNAFFPASIYGTVAVFLAGFLSAAGWLHIWLTKLVRELPIGLVWWLVWFSCPDPQDVMIFKFPFHKGKKKTFFSFFFFCFFLCLRTRF